MSHRMFSLPAGRWLLFLSLLTGAALLTAQGAGKPVVPAPDGGAIPIYDYRIVRSYPHDRRAFTQGLIYVDGDLYEGTGLNGASSVRRVELRSGKVLQQVDLDGKYFGEGLTAWGPNLIQLTLRSNLGFVYDRSSLRQRQTFSYPGEGWGLTHDDREVIMSDGTPDIRFLDPKTLVETHRIHVTAQGRPVDQINELEWVEGEIYANIWQTDRIARIDPKTGRVLGWIDLAGLLPKADVIPQHTDVLNGIAYDAAGKRLFVTGKMWPKLFEIRLVRKAAGAR